MAKFNFVFFILLLGIPSIAYGQVGGNNQATTMNLKVGVDMDIFRFDDDTDQSMKCENARKAFQKDFEENPTNAYAALYLGRAFDLEASIDGSCEIADDDFLRYCDSALRYFRIADKLQHGIKEKKHGFSISMLVGHTFGARCLWRLKHGDYDKARQEMIRGMKEGGYSPAQIEVCRLMLDLCDTGAIFFPAGDDDTFPVMYLQMVEGYRTDVSVINLSLVNFPWYLRLFLSDEKKGFASVEVTLSQIDIDSLMVVDTKRSLPDRLFTDVGGDAQERIHKEVGVDVADKAEICFPVYLPYAGGYYTYGAQKAIASILMANKWRRRVFFGLGGLENVLNCTHVSIRDAGLIQELYPINTGQSSGFLKGDRWFHEEKMKQVFLHDAKMEKFSATQTSSDGQAMLYYGLAQYLLAMDSADKSKDELIRRIQSIPRKSLEGSEKTIFACAQVMFRAGFKEEAKKICIDLLPVFEQNLSGSKASFQQDDVNYIIALVIAGDCPKALEFVNSFKVSQEMKAQVVHEIQTYYGCR